MKLVWDFSEFNEFAENLQNVSEFERFAKQATRELAKELHEMLFQITPVKTGQLAAGWGGENYAYTIESFKYGYRITLRNQVPYAHSVNDGHYSHNQFNAGEPTGYLVKNRTPKIYTIDGANQDETYVFGHFFVEKAIVEISESSALEQIIMKELQKWWDSI